MPIARFPFTGLMDAGFTRQIQTQCADGELLRHLSDHVSLFEIDPEQDFKVDFDTDNRFVICSQSSPPSFSVDSDVAVPSVDIDAGRPKADAATKAAVRGKPVKEQDPAPSITALAVPVLMTVSMRFKDGTSQIFQKTRSFPHPPWAGLRIKEFGLLPAIETVYLLDDNTYKCVLQNSSSEIGQDVGGTAMKRDGWQPVENQA